MPASNRHALEDLRRELVVFLETKRPQGSSRNKVTIVFDGRMDVSSPKELSTIDVIFSRNETADEKICRMVSSAANKRNIVVVTNDRDIQYAVRAMGAKVIGVSEFLRKTVPSAPMDDMKTKLSAKKTAAKNISKTLEFEITSEFSKIWLEKEKRKNR
jgi:predicted RNA-binding protein with PIN domain